METENKDENKIPDIDDSSSPPRETANYYSRERRLKHASAMVRAMNEGGGFEKRNLLERLFVTRGNVLFFGCIILIVFVLILTSRLNLLDRGLTLGRNSLTVVITQEGGINILSIYKSAPRRGEVYFGAVDINVLPAVSDSENSLENPAVFQHRIVFNPLDRESFLVTLPFGGDDFFVRLRAGNEERAIRVQSNPSD